MKHVHRKVYVFHCNAMSHHIKVPQKGFFFLMFVLLRCGIGAVVAQGPTSYWYFGDSAGVRFENYIPSPLLDNVLEAPAGCAAISDDSGELLYYAHPGECIGSDHSGVYNGAALTGVLTSTQGVIYVPHPKDPMVHYVFTNNSVIIAPFGLYYSVIERTWAHSLGEIKPFKKNIELLGAKGERMTAVHHANGQAVWLLYRVHHSDTIVAYLVDTNGLNSTPVVSIVANGTYSSAGQLKSSPNGNFLAECTSILYMDGPQALLHRFDNATGLVSNSISIYDSNMYVWGCEFSPNSDYVYFANHTVIQEGGIVQFNLASYDSAQVVASKEIIPSNQLLALQIGVDRKIYGASVMSGFGAENSYYLGRIENPNAPAGNILYDSNAVHLAGRSCLDGLPDFIQSYFHPAYFDFTRNCENDSTRFFVRSPVVDAVLWNFGDTASGANNISNELNPTHVFTSKGSFTVSLTLWADSTIDTFTRVVSIYEPPDPLMLADTIYKCVTDTVETDISQPISICRYYWSTGSDSGWVRLPDAGTYWAVAYNFCDTVSDTFRIVDVNPLSLDLGIDTAICEGDSLLIDPGFSKGASYSWWNGDTISYQRSVGSFDSENLEPLLIWVAASNACGTASDSLELSFIAFPNGSLPADTVQCVEAPVYVYRHTDAGTDYTWSDSSSGPSLKVDSTSSIWLFASNQCGLSSDTMHLLFYPQIKVELGEDTVICNGDSVLLNASWPGSEYLWNIGSTDSAIVATAEGNYAVTITSGPCQLVEQRTLSVQSCDSAVCRFDIPNVFTPNGDGVNDVFSITSSCSNHRFSVFIYNRWGNLIWTQSSSRIVSATGRASSVHWDGYVHGSPVVAGTYFYYLESGERIYKGALTLIR